jgi:uncharacterized protein YdaU (DUF1376 family)
MNINSTKPLQWMKFWIDENLRTTARLSTTEYGAYMLLARDYWTAGPPGDDDNLLARITGLPVVEWRKIRPVIEPLFVVGGGQWVNPKIDADIEATYAAIRTSRARSAAATKARWSKKANRDGIRQGERDGIRNGERDGIRNGERDVILDVSADGYQDFKGAPQKPLAKREPVFVPVATDSDGDNAAGDSLPGWEGCHVY